jgi:hypothetical protein
MIRSTAKKKNLYILVTYWENLCPCAEICDLMFCWPCIIVHQYSETNVTHSLFNLLRINGLYKFRALSAHPKEALFPAPWNPGATNWHNTHALYQVQLAKRLWVWASKAWNLQRPSVRNKLNRKCVTLVSLYWILWLWWRIFRFHNRQHPEEISSYSAHYRIAPHTKNSHFLRWENLIKVPPREVISIKKAMSHNLK